MQQHICICDTGTASVIKADFKKQGLKITKDNPVGYKFVFKSTKQKSTASRKLEQFVK